ncbi:MAG TPA: TolC family protein [Steroidobacteraceae bacterium]|nr:TolC family protein [Steroidobacteraceae bacterium]
MSAKTYRAKCSLKSLIFVLAASSGFGQEPPLSDPLGVNPQVLRNGSRLPGDDAIPPCPARVIPGQTLDLALAADVALCNSPKVRSTWEAIKVQTGVLGEAKAAYLPSVSGSYTLQRERNMFPDVPQENASLTGHSAFAGATWRLFDFGERAANRDYAQLLLSAAIASHDAQLQEILDGLVGAYFDAMTALAGLGASQKSRSLASATLEATGRREERGAASHSDTLQAQVALAKSVLAEKRAVGSYGKAMSILAYSMGLSADVTFNLPELDRPSAEAVGELTAWLSAAENQNPSLTAAREQWEAMNRKIVATRSEGRATVDFSADWFENGYPSQGIQTTSSRQTTYGLTVTVPLFEGFARTYKVEEATAQAKGAQAQYEDTRYQILMNVVKAHADAVSALGNLDASEALLSASGAAAESSGRRYASGAANILELLSAQSNLAEAEQQRVQCLSEWYAARLRLWTSAGALGLSRLQRSLSTLVGPDANR